MYPAFAAVLRDEIKARADHAGFVLGQWRIDVGMQRSTVFIPVNREKHFTVSFNTIDLIVMDRRALVVKAVDRVMRKMVSEQS